MIFEPPQQQDDMAMRRQALSRMLMGQQAPAAGYRTPEGTAMNAGTQAIQSMAADPRFMKWLNGSLGFGGAAAAPAASPAPVGAPTP